MGQFGDWLNVGDEILLATDGRDVFIYKIPSSDTGVDADIKTYDTARKDIESQNFEEHGVAAEGKSKEYYGIRYERSSKNRASAIKIHGIVCNGCGFDFEAKYGEHGIGFIEVHHINPIGSRGGREVIIDPKTDLITVCSNCHRIIHRNSKSVMSIEELRVIVRQPRYK